RHDPERVERSPPDPQTFGHLLEDGAAAPFVQNRILEDETQLATRRPRLRHPADLFGYRTELVPFQAQLEDGLCIPLNDRAFSHDRTSAAGADKSWLRPGPSRLAKSSSAKRWWSSGRNSRRIDSS